MRRVVGLAAAVLAVSLAGCSSDDSMAVEIAITYPTQYSQPVPAVFSASGVAVDEAVVCESGTTEVDHYESTEGVTMTSEEWAESEEWEVLLEAARADDGVLELYRVEEFVCDDGSGTFATKLHSRADFAKPESQQESHTWVIENGTGDYADLSGSGERSMTGRGTEDFVVVFSGQVQTG